MAQTTGRFASDLGRDRIVRSTARAGALAGVLVAALILAAGGCGSGAGGGRASQETAAQDATATTRGLSGIVRSEPLVVAGLEWTDARSQQNFLVTPEPGHVNLVYFGYTSCPDVCPTTLSDLRRALRELGEERASQVSLIFVTVDPERDTTEILDGFVSSFVPRNHVVRFTDPAVLAEAQRPFMARSQIGPRSDDGTYEVAHTGLLYAVGSGGTVLVEWPFGTSSDAIAADLATVLDSEAQLTGTRETT